MNEETLKEFLFSLGWSCWSAHHDRNSARIIKQLCPNLDADAELAKFQAIIESPPGPGSPK